MSKSLSRPADLSVIPRSMIKSPMLWCASVTKNHSDPRAQLSWQKQEERPCLKTRWKTKTDGKLSSDNYKHHGAHTHTYMHTCMHT